MRVSRASFELGADAGGGVTASTVRQPQHRLGGDAGWMALTVVTVIVAALIPLLWEPRFYFLGDTQMGAYGQWYHLGEKLRSGQWPLLDLQAWHGGNYVSEGQWGLFSPLTMAIGLAATVVQHAVLFVTALKFGFLVLASLGVFVLIRSYRVPPYAAFLAGVAVTVGGATQYLDAPDWVTGLMVWSMIPWAWWALRRTMNHNAHPAAALVFGLLTVTVGYVYGTIYLAIVIIACLLDAVLARNRAGALRVLLVGVCCGLVAVTVYLPGILSASVTTRASTQIVSDGRLQADVPGLLASMIPTVLSPASPVPPSPAYPAHYIAWFLPLLAWVDVRRARRLLRPLSGLLLVLLVGVLWALGPNQIGALRWPIRVMPFVTLATIMLVVIFSSKAQVRRPSRRRLVLSLSVTAGAAYLVMARFWSQNAMTLTSTAFVLLGLAVVWALTRLGDGSSSRARWGDPAVIAAFMALWSLGVVGVQHSYYPWPTAVDRHMPSTISGYSTQAATAQGDVMVVGDPEKAVLTDPAAVHDFLVASSWYVNPHPVQNIYSTIGFTGFNDLYCMAFNGNTCPSALNTLFERESTTGALRVDLLSVSTLQIVRADFDESTLLSPPAGWHLSEQTRFAVTWVRDKPLASAGGVVWSSPGLDVTPLSASTNKLVLRVDSAPPQGGTIVLSRLEWPGYHVSGGALVKPTDGYLTTVQVPAVASGQTVTISYAPPGWTLEMVALSLGVGLATVWSIGALVRSRRRRSRR